MSEKRQFNKEVSFLIIAPFLPVLAIVFWDDARDFLSSLPIYIWFIVGIFFWTVFVAKWTYNNRFFFEAFGEARRKRKNINLKIDNLDND